jgi:hypothetical protein
MIGPLIVAAGMEVLGDLRMAQLIVGVCLLAGHETGDEKDGTARHRSFMREKRAAQLHAVLTSSIGYGSVSVITGVLKCPCHLSN